MRFFLIVFAFTLFLVVNASPAVPPNHSPEVTACIKSLNNLHDRTSDFLSTLRDELKSTRNYGNVLLYFFGLAVSSRKLGYIKTGFEDVFTTCKKVALVTKDERTALKQAYKDFVIVTQENAQLSRFLMRIARESGVIQKVSPHFKDVLRSLFRKYASNFHAFRISFSTLIPTNEVPELESPIQDIERDLTIASYDSGI